MSDWTPAAVRAAVAEWLWVPPDAEQTAYAGGHPGHQGRALQRRRP